MVRAARSGHRATTNKEQNEEKQQNKGGAQGAGSGPGLARNAWFRVIRLQARQLLRPERTNGAAALLYCDNPS